MFHAYWCLIFRYIWILHACYYPQVQQGYLELELEIVWAIMWVQGIEPWTFGRAVNHLSSASVLHFSLWKFSFYLKKITCFSQIFNMYSIKDNANYNIIDSPSITFNFMWTIHNNFLKIILFLKHLISYEHAAITKSLCMVQI